MKVKKEVNALYKELEIEIDGIFRTMLLLKKKKYAALKIVEGADSLSTTRETKVCVCVCVCGCVCVVVCVCVCVCV